MDRNNNNDASRIPDGNNSKPMDSKRDVEKSPDPKTDQDFPGYPHYPAKEDMMAQDSGDYRVDADVEGLAAGQNASGMNQRYVSSQQHHMDQDPSEAQAEGESDGLDAVNSTEDEIGTPQNVSDEDLPEGQ